jgi:hypothetical protein
MRLSFRQGTSVVAIVSCLLSGGGCSKPPPAPVAAAPVVKGAEAGESPLAQPAAAQEGTEQSPAKMTVYLQADLAEEGIEGSDSTGYRPNDKKYVKTGVSISEAEFEALVKHSKDAGRKPDQFLNTDREGKVREFFTMGVHWSDPKLVSSLADEIKKRHKLSLPLRLNCCRYYQDKLYVDVRKPR